MIFEMLWLDLSSPQAGTFWLRVWFKVCDLLQVSDQGPKLKKMKLVRNGSFVSRREALVRRVSLMLRRFGMKWEFLTLKLVWLLYTNDNGICSLDPYAMYLPCSLHRIHVPPLRHDCHYPQWHCRNGTLLIYFQFYYLEG